MQDAGLATKTYDDSGHAEQEGLDPKFEKLALVFEDVTVRKRSSGGLELHPVDGIVGSGGFGIPDYTSTMIVERSHAERRSRHNIRASTSPPKTSLDCPMPVLTIEQYWAWLFTTSPSRLSM